MSFHQPFWLLLLLPLPFLALLRIWSHVSTGRGGRNFVSPRLRPELIVGASQGLRWTVFCLNLLAIACLVVAIARPQWGTHEAESISEGRNLIVAIDTSRSMLATDIQPDRMTRAKLAAQDIIASLPEDRIGLIAFAGKAFLQAPLTVDHDAILESIDQLDTEIIPRGGTNLEEPVQLALETFEEAESKESALIIFSDGEDLEGEQAISDLKAKASELGMIIVAIGVGTEAGSIIPEPDSKGRPQPGIFVKDESGNVVRTRLDPKALQDLSAESGAGVYVNLGSASSITSLVNKSIETLSATRLDDQARLVPIERFMWPLSAAVLLWVVAFLLPASTRAFIDRRAKKGLSSANVPPPIPVRGRSITGWVALGFTTMSAFSGHAADRTDSIGFEALKKEDYDAAITSYESEVLHEESERKRTWLNLGLGSAAYLEGDYEKAQQSFGRVLAEAGSRDEVEKAHFNLGNSLFRKGQIVMGWDKKQGSGSSEMLQQISDPGTREEARLQWNSALEHYEAALNLNNSNAKAEKNIEVVKAYLEYLDKIEEEEKQQEEEEKKDEEQNKEDEEEKEDDQKEEDQKDDQKEDKGEDQQNDQGEDQKDQQQDQNQDSPQQDQNPEDQKSEEQSDDKQDGQNDNSEDPNQEDPQDGEPQGNEGEEGGEPEDQENRDGKPEDGENGAEQEKPFEPEDQGPPPEDKPGEGELEANPTQPENQKPMTPQQAAAQQAAAAARQANPETGYSPSEARQLLRALADENMEVKPIFAPMKAEKYKNW